MKTLAAALALAGAIWGCDAKASSTAVVGPAPAPQAGGPTYTERVKIDDV